MREFFACANAGDDLRQIALFTDEGVRALYPDGQDDISAVLDALAEPVVAAPESDWLAYREIAVVEADDGRVGVVVVENRFFDNRFYFELIWQGDRLLIDRFFIIPSMPMGNCPNCPAVPGPEAPGPEYFPTSTESPAPSAEPLAGTPTETPIA